MPRRSHHARIVARAVKARSSSNLCDAVTLGLYDVSVRLIWLAEKLSFRFFSEPALACRLSGLAWLPAPRFCNSRDFGEPASASADAASPCLRILRRARAAIDSEMGTRSTEESAFSSLPAIIFWNASRWIVIRTTDDLLMIDAVRLPDSCRKQRQRSASRWLR